MRVQAAPRARRVLPAFALGLACAAAQAAPNDPVDWLKRAAQAAREASFAGTYVHTNGERISTIRITHVNAGGEEHERIEPLDAATHEIVRRNDEMYCRFPDAKTVRLDPRITARFFPRILDSDAAAVSANYDVKLGGTERVLGFECQWIHLVPRDTLRYPQRFCSEVGTGLVVRAKTLDAIRGHVIEQYTFTELRLGPSVPRGDVQSIFKARTRQWISDGKPRDEVVAAQTGWEVTQPPAGFRQVAELKRMLPGRAEPVAQIVLSDGLATMSVFVEEVSARAGPRAEASSEDGTTTFFVRPVGELVVSVLGEVPLAAAQQAGRSVARRP